MVFAADFAARAAIVPGTLWAVCLTATAAMPTSIELRPRVEVAEAQVRLGDIAYLQGPDLAALRQLMAVPIGAAPRPGSRKLVDRDAVVRWVEARVEPKSVRWSGATDIEIESAAKLLPGETVVDAARAGLRAWLLERGVRAEVQAASAPHDLMLPAGKPTLRIRPLGAEAPRAGRTWVWIDAWVDERFVRSAAVAFDVASVTGEAGDGVERSTPAPVTAPVTADTPLPPSPRTAPPRLAATPAVKRGERANLRVLSGDVSIESRVEVLQDGQPGQLVRIKVAGSSGEVLARVTGPGQVEVQP